jgi:hypothetical protein
MLTAVKTVDFRNKRNGLKVFATQGLSLPLKTCRQGDQRENAGNRPIAWREIRDAGASSGRRISSRKWKNSHSVKNAISAPHRTNRRL